MTLRTPLCDLLGIEHPIVQSGMGGVAGPDLVAEVSKAGGLGIIAGLNLTPDQIRDAIRRVRAATDRPFGVNLFMPNELRPPTDPAAIPAATVAAVQGRSTTSAPRLGLPTTTARPPAGARSHRRRVRGDRRRARPGLVDRSRRPRTRDGQPLPRPRHESDGHGHHRGRRAHPRAPRRRRCWWRQGSEAGGHRSIWVKRSDARARRHRHAGARPADRRRGPRSRDRRGRHRRRPRPGGRPRARRGRRAAGHALRGHARGRACRSSRRRRCWRRKPRPPR